ncbi:NACHT, LRR and PYD domains-containing protein 12-like isoform X2 [Clupea harengus]|uniref:NACHT, LRR and PYD domains-containing protein 12-like isoform X2 n=1 Tax=Clupea harengus TaxID=7950 RepID=A0A6P8FTE3_CLUHA|nr:NACHT, LRR and PYD domains-containing protein 12-like isoform X2 [Clupea harengus]
MSGDVEPGPYEISDGGLPTEETRKGPEGSGRTESPCGSEVSYRSKEEPPDLKEGHCNIEDRSGDIASPAGCHHEQRDMGPQEEAVQGDHKSPMKQKYRYLWEGGREPSSYTLIPYIDTDMYISNQKELSEAKTMSEEVLVEYNGILQPQSGQENPIRSVLTVGVSGVGKTVTVQRFIQDWADGKANQDIHSIFPLPFRKLNLIREKQCSLLYLLEHFYKDAMDRESFDKSTLFSENILVIFDGLDECQYPLDFQNNPICSDLSAPAPVDVLLTNLIKGNLLPSALLWITSRPETASRIPPSCIDRETEVRGFNDSSKEDYIQMKIHDQSLASKIIKFLRSSPSLYSMCQIPVYCRILVSVLERLLSNQEIAENPESGEIPQTLTQIYTYFLFIQTNIPKEKSPTPEYKVENIIFKLGKLAFQQLEKGNLIFYEDDLKASDLSPSEVSLYPGVCAESLRQELGLRKETVFHFGHISIQEHLAALYVFLSFANREEATSSSCCHPTASSQLASLFRASSVYELLKNAVDLSLQSEHGRLDFFLRFLVGFSLESNQTLLQGLLVREGSASNLSRKTVEYIQKKICENPFPDKCMNLFHCLSELHNLCSLEEVVRARLSPATESRHSLTPAQCSAVAFLLLNSGEELAEFDMTKYTDTEECVLRLLPVIKASRSALLHGCNITSQGCKRLASILKSESCLEELDLSNNDLQDSGFSQLLSGLQHPLCNLHTLKLWYCSLTDKSCEQLAETLGRKSSLKALNLSRNSVQDAGLRHLCSGLQNPDSQLEKLKLDDCVISAEGCEALGSVLGSESSCLRELSLGNNNLLDLGLGRLCSGLNSPHCRLEKLGLRECGLTHSSCVALAAALGSGSSRLRELNLSENELQDVGMKLLSQGMRTPDRTLQRLQLRYCGLTASSCESLSSVLPSLMELDLSGNNLQDTGVTTLSWSLTDPSCKLKKLQLSYCGMSDVGGAALGSALGRATGPLELLEMTGNSLQDPDLKLKLRSLHCLL